MESSNLDDDYRGVKLDEIRWTPDESVDLLVMDPDQLYRYARDLQVECEGLRVLLHHTLKALGRANVQRDRQSARLSDLIGELRLSRQNVRALEAQLRAWQDDAA